MYMLSIIGTFFEHCSIHSIIGKKIFHNWLTAVASNNHLVNHRLLLMQPKTVTTTLGLDVF